MITSEIGSLWGKKTCADTCTVQIMRTKLKTKKKKIWITIITYLNTFSFSPSTQKYTHKYISQNDLTLIVRFKCLQTNTIWELKEKKTSLW